eukprot:TRINITY_DN23060_c1_g1_i1.p1 TRINITY_DN23060_c1_g1~~TRINITY_DN23060_c1_g1_i1.p1  ORF type:complete len:103 (+),score=8.42 TRINITY_DN23060_c1_g1_i1:1568-1876(+)
MLVHQIMFFVYKNLSTVTNKLLMAGFTNSKGSSFRICETSHEELVCDGRKIFVDEKHDLVDKHEEDACRLCPANHHEKMHSWHPFVKGTSCRQRQHLIKGRL